MSKLASVLMAAMLLPCIASAQVPSGYHATMLGVGTPIVMNNKGQVAGLDRFGHPVLWSRTGVATSLTGQVEQPYISGINDDGTVIGYGLLADYESGLYQPLVWRNGGSLERLDLPGQGAVPAGINNHGDIVGLVNPAGDWPPSTVGFLKRESGIVYFDGFNPRAVNDLGEVLGDGDASIAIWRDGELSDIPHSCCSSARDFNNHDWVIGSVDYTEARLWKDGQYQDMWRGYAFDINDAGIVVGQYEFGSAVLWYQGQAYALDQLWHEAQWSDWRLSSAVAINESGEIAAIASNAVTGEQVNVLLVPVPEPAMAWLLLLGLPWLRLGRRSG